MTNVMQDSFHAMYLLDEYVSNKFDNSDIIMVLDFVFFYTELQMKYILDALNWAYNYFNDEYDDECITKFKIYKNIISMIIEGYKICAKYSTIKIDNKFYIQKEGVIIGKCFAPNHANLVALINFIKNKIYNNNDIKLNIRSIDDTLILLKNTKGMNIKYIYNEYFPSILKYTFEITKYNTIKFLDLLLMRGNDTLQYVMQIKQMKLEFFVPFQSNHPMHMKVSIIKNMVVRVRFCLPLHS